MLYYACKFNNNFFLTFVHFFKIIILYSSDLPFFLHFNFKSKYNSIIVNLPIYHIYVYICMYLQISFRCKLLFLIFIIWIFSREYNFFCLFFSLPRGAEVFSGSSDFSPGKHSRNKPLVRVKYRGLSFTRELSANSSSSYYYDYYYYLIVYTLSHI